MAQLTHLDSKLGEVLGLAQAAQQATKKVARMAKKDARLIKLLDRMGREAKQTEQRCFAAAERMDGKKSAIQRKARETKQEAQQMHKAYLEGKDEALDGLEFLLMAEAGELNHWEILGKMSDRAGDRRLRKLVDQVIPIQQRHLSDVRASSLTLAVREDPGGEA